MRRLAIHLAAVLALWPVAAAMAQSQQIRWRSATTQGELTGEVMLPEAAAAKPWATVVYLKNLSVPRVGRESDEKILADLRSSGDLVLVLDYHHSGKAVAEALNADILKIRKDIADARSRSLLADQPVDVNHLFILMEGFRLKRDVAFARDGKRVLGMDVMYPSKPEAPVPALMEITCDNVNRMGSASLLFCHDSLLEGAEAAGFAVAMVDHPVAPPYKGIDDPMPESLYRMKAAVRTLRSLGPELGLNQKIGVMGFSRGGPFAGMLAVTNGRSDLEGDGMHQDAPSEVQAALVHGNRYDFSKVGPDDPMYKRFEKAWRPFETNRETWLMHGAVHYLAKNAAPVFLNTSDAESKEYRDGLRYFYEALQVRGAECAYQVDTDGRGHRVSEDPQTLARIYGFLQRHLK